MHVDTILEIKLINITIFLYFHTNTFIIKPVSALMRTLSALIYTK